MHLATRIVRLEKEQVPSSCPRCTHRLCWLEEELGEQDAGAPRRCPGCGREIADKIYGITRELYDAV